jgi:hypothetical protein
MESPPAGLSNVKAIAARNEFTVALKDNGQVVVWGRNCDDLKQLPKDLKNVRLLRLAATIFWPRKATEL